MKRVRSPKGTYGENKIRVNLTLSPEAVQMTEEMSRSIGIYRSELIERLVREHARTFLTSQSPALTNAVELDADIVFDCELTLLHMGEPLFC